MKNHPSSFWQFDSIYDWKKKSKIEIDQFFYFTNVATGLKMQGIDDFEQRSNIRLEFSSDKSETSFFKIFKQNIAGL